MESETAAAKGLFFDYRPWLFGGLAVLILSIVFWTPFVLGITRYAKRISRATEQIADGNFNTKIGASRGDELGLAGESIEEMSARIGTLVSGQKRFLADVAHELCAPLARIRTGLGIAQNGADSRLASRLDSIDEDAEELSSLVSELMAFTKTGTSNVEIESVNLTELVKELAARELQGHPVEIAMRDLLFVNADRRLLSRAVSNVFRNCNRHGGADCAVKITGRAEGNDVRLIILDDGPGVPQEEVHRLLEPFYRPDKSRSRDTGGAGLGLAIVDNCLRAFGGRVFADNNDAGGFLVDIHLPVSSESPA